VDKTLKYILLIALFGILVFTGFVVAGMVKQYLYPSTAQGQIVKLTIYFEDTELAFRLRLFGYKCIYEPDAVCYHYGGRKRDKHNKFYVEFGRRNIEFLFFKNMQGHLFAKYFLSHYLYEFILFLFFLNVGKGIPFLKAKIQFLKNLGYLLQERKKLKSTLMKTNGLKEVPKIEQYFFRSKRGLWDKVKKAVRTYITYLNLS